MKINIRSVLSEVNRAGSVFTIRYRRHSDGLVGEHKRCALLRREANKLNQHQRWNRGGQLRLMDLDTGEKFQIQIDFILRFNGVSLEHRQ